MSIDHEPREAPVQDIIERLDAELAAAPAAGFGIDQTVHAGRTVVRRRRVTAGALTLTAVLAVGGVAWAVSPGGDKGADRSPVAGDPTTSAAPSEQPSSDPADDAPLTFRDGMFFPNQDASTGSGESYVAASGEQVEIYRISLHGTEYFAYGVPATGDIGWVTADGAGMGLKKWVDAERTAPLPVDDGSWVRIDASSRLTALSGVRIVTQRPDPGFGDRFAAAGEPTAVAEVTRKGRRFFLAVRPGAGGAAEAIPFAPTRKVATLDAFVDHARAQYATNDQGGSEGLR